MNKSFEQRLEALEGRRGVEVYVVLLGDDCDAYDAARKAGDLATARDILRRNNTHVNASELDAMLREPVSWRDLDGALTLIRVNHEDLSE